MLDFKGLWFRWYEYRSIDKFKTEIESVRSVYATLSDPLTYTAFALYCGLRSASPEYSVKVSLEDVAHDMRETLNMLGDVSPYELADGIELLMRYKKAPAIVKDRFESMCKCYPEVIFCPMPWLSVAVDFIRRFNKEDYPLVEGWSDFIMLLPLERINEKKLYLSFSDYVRAIDSGKFDRLYRTQKLRGISLDNESFRSNYVTRLSRADADELKSCLVRYDWGRGLAKDEMKKREGRIKI